MRGFMRDHWEIAAATLSLAAYIISPHIMPAITALFCVAMWADRHWDAILNEVAA